MFKLNKTQAWIEELENIILQLKVELKLLVKGSEMYLKTKKKLDNFQELKTTLEAMCNTIKGED
jgi:hypothetical protein